jgi:hypothetical protein
MSFMEKFVKEQLTTDPEFKKEWEESELEYQIQQQIIRQIIEIGDELIWKYDKIGDEILVIRKPKCFSDTFWGLGKEIWEKENGNEYVRKERETWE